jgi:hypothetical protein
MSHSGAIIGCGILYEDQATEHDEAESQANPTYWTVWLLCSISCYRADALIVPIIMYENFIFYLFRRNCTVIPFAEVIRCGLQSFQPRIRVAELHQRNPHF